MRSNRPRPFQFLLHSHGRSRAFFNGTINKTTPSNGPIRVRKEDVSMSTTQRLQRAGQELRGREEPCSFGEFILAPVVEDLFVISIGLHMVYIWVR